MANSNAISRIKNKLIKEMIKDMEIVAAIDSRTVPASKSEQLKGTHIFDFHQAPDTIKDVETFITIQVHIPDTYRRTDGTFVNPVLEIWIISHERHMTVDNVPKVIENRNDYISELLDRKFNGRNGFGIGDMTLVSNIEGTYQQDYLYRKMTFRITDLNDSLCDVDD